MVELKENEVNARPTKEFFIDSLVRDIPLIDVIPDLVDNCYDGALRIEKGDDLKGLKIEVEIDKDHFKIKDNCGGIPLKIAKEYAFRFGRDKNYIPPPGSSGQFGIGMKRAIFKVGNKIRIESKTSNEHFLIEFDVSQWKKKDDDWSFDLKIISDKESPNKLKEAGLVIEVTELYEESSKEFENDEFIHDLFNKLKTANSMRLEKGLNIILNNKPIGFEPFEVFTSEKLTPAYEKREIGHGEKKITIEIYAGIGERDPKKAGWYIFCNGRLLLSANKDKETGWGTGKGNPEYHNDFAYFRGFVFFNSKDGSLLPWDTTKTRVDVDSAIYKAVRLKMMALSAPVFSFLRKVAKEKAEDESGNKPDYMPINDEISKTKKKDILSLKLHEGNFTFIEPEAPKPKIKYIRISYTMPEEKVKRVKKVLGIVSNKRVGEKTFEYFYEQEVEGVD